MGTSSSGKGGQQSMPQYSSSPSESAFKNWQEGSSDGSGLALEAGNPNYQFGDTPRALGAFGAGVAGTMMGGPMMGMAAAWESYRSLRDGALGDFFNTRPNETTRDALEDMGYSRHDLALACSPDSVGAFLGSAMAFALVLGAPGPGVAIPLRAVLAAAPGHVEAGGFVFRGFEGQPHHAV